ncbi:MAG: DUF1638 domain-containing protein [Candidatus Geothermincolia bacterium]
METGMTVVTLNETVTWAPGGAEDALRALLEQLGACLSRQGAVIGHIKGRLHTDDEPGLFFSLTAAGADPHLRGGAPRPPATLSLNAIVAGIRADDLRAAVADAVAANTNALGEEAPVMVEGIVRVIACATVAEELRHIGVVEPLLEVLDFGLHINPDELRTTLQARITELDAEPPGHILLGYGLCSNALVGLSSERHTLVVPRIDDCIALFFGSKREHLRLLAEEPGTYFLTKGWVEAADVPYNEYLRMVERYGEERALRVAKLMLANYTRVALINTGNYHMDEFREFARNMAELFGLRFEELPGSNRLLMMLLAGDWEEEFIVVPPGRPLGLGDFLGDGFR